MQVYIFLMELTDDGIREIKHAPKRIEAAIASFEAVGGKCLEIYPVMGKYNYVAIGEAPDDVTAMTFVLGLDTLGNVRTTVLRSFSVEKYSEMIDRLRLGITPV